MFSGPTVLSLAALRGGQHTRNYNAACTWLPMPYALQAERRQLEDDKAREAMKSMMLSKEHLSELKQREMIRMQARTLTASVLHTQACSIQHRTCQHRLYMSHRLYNSSAKR